MNLITRFDERKFFIVDADITKVVQLMKVRGDGFGEVKDKAGKSQTLNLDRLMPYDEKEKIVDIVPKIEKIVFFIKNPDNSILVKTLEGEEAIKWEKMMVSVCMVADKENKLPDFLSLKWKEEELPIEEKQNG